MLSRENCDVSTIFKHAMSDDEFILTVEQIEMALKALRWTFQDLAKKAGVHRNTVNNAKHRSVSPKSLRKIRKAFEKAGLEILEPGQNPGPGGSGIRWRDRVR